MGGAHSTLNDIATIAFSARITGSIQIAVVVVVRADREIAFKSAPQATFPPPHGPEANAKDTRRRGTCFAATKPAVGETPAFALSEVGQMAVMFASHGGCCQMVTAISPVETSYCCYGISPLCEVGKEHLAASRKVGFSGLFSRHIYSRSSKAS